MARGCGLFLRANIGEAAEVKAGGPEVLDGRLTALLPEPSMAPEQRKDERQDNAQKNRRDYGEVKHRVLAAETKSPGRRPSRGKPSLAPSMTSRPAATRANPAKIRRRPRFTSVLGAGAFQIGPVYSLAGASPCAATDSQLGRTAPNALRFLVEIVSALSGAARIILRMRNPPPTFAPEVAAPLVGGGKAG